MDKLTYFSKFRRRPIRDSAGNRIGTVDDLIVRDGEKVADVIFVVIQTPNGRGKIPWELVEKFNGEIRLKKEADNFQPAPIEPGEMLLHASILDRQLIDINGLKVVRVNDVVMLDVEGKLTVISVDAGMQGFIRRLGLPAGIFKEANLIPWEYLEPISTEAGIRLKVPRARIATLHPADIADLLEELTPKERASVFGRLDVETAADTLAESEPDVTRSVVAEIKERKIASVLERMSPDEAADVLSILPSHKVTEIMRHLPHEYSAKLHDLFDYDEEVAGRIMNPEVITVNVANTAQQVIDYMRSIAPNAERLYYIYVIDDERRLVGVLSLRQLIITPPQTKVSDFMRMNVIKVSDKAPKEEAAKLIVKYDLSLLPVVSAGEKLLGVISRDAVLTGVIPQSYKNLRPKRKYYLKRSRKPRKAP